MPVLVDNSKIERKIIPSSKFLNGDPLPEADWGWVDIDTSDLKARDMYIVDEGMTRGEMGIAILVQRIKDWNYTGQDGQKLPINLDTLGLLSSDDVESLTGFINVEVEPLDAEQKKTSTESVEETKVPVDFR